MSSSSTRAACASTPRTSCIRVWANCASRRTTPAATPMVAVTGCVAQQEGESLLKRSSMVDVVVGTRRLRMLPMLVEQAARTHVAQVDLGAHDNVAFPFGVTRRDDPVRAWVTIIEGCNEYCSFCVVPTRGATSGCGRRPTSWPRCATPPPGAFGKSSCWAKSSTTTRRPTTPPATSRRCSRRSTTSTASRGSGLPARILGM